MSVSIRRQDHNGIKFTMYECGVSRGECAGQIGKFHLDGKSSVTCADGQYKYGDEVIIQIFAQAGTMTKRERVNDNYDRVQVFFKKKDFMDICRKIVEREDEELRKFQEKFPF